MINVPMRDGSIVHDPRLGALIDHDPRSDAFPVSASLPTDEPQSKYWDVSTWLNQGSQGTCVGHGIAHDALAKPVRIPNVNHQVALDIFCRAQEIDPFPGDCSDGQYSGTSLTAGMEAARERGWYQEYRWAHGLDDAKLSVGHLGPGIIAIDWHEDMYSPDALGYIHPTGNWVGRHCLLVYSINVSEECFWLWNNWGEEWGKRGTARLSFPDFSELISRNSGEMAIPTIRSYGEAVG